MITAAAGPLCAFMVHTAVTRRESRPRSHCWLTALMVALAFQPWLWGFDQWQVWPMVASALPTLAHHGLGFALAHGGLSLCGLDLWGALHG